MTNLNISDSPTGPKKAKKEINVCLEEVNTSRTVRRLNAQLDVTNGKISSCLLCLNSDCAVKYFGEPQYSSNYFLFGFPWRRNSCALDAIASGIFFIWTNFDAPAQQSFEKYFSELASIFNEMITGRTNTFEAKIALERLYAKNCDASNLTNVTEFELHKFADVRSVFNVLIDTENTKTPFFTSDVTSVKTCPTCHASCTPEKLHFNVFDLDAYLLPNSDEVERGFKASSTCSEQKVSCSNCKIRLVRSYSKFSGPSIFYNSPGLTKEKKKNYSSTAHVPTSIEIHGSIYRLSCVIYFTPGHFVVMARHPATGEIFFCDGMLNNAVFSSTPYKEFPFKFTYGEKECTFESSFYLPKNSQRAGLAS